MLIDISDKAIDPWQWLARAQAQLISSGALKQHRFGASANFIGTMRDFNDDQTIQAMELVHYPSMTKKELENILHEALTKHAILQAAITHRIGKVSPSDTLVVVAVWSAHRNAAFEACREIMEALKHRAPFWKKEHTDKGARWVAKNTQG